MKLVIAFTVLIVTLFNVENRMIISNFDKIAAEDDATTPIAIHENERTREHIMILTNSKEDKDYDEDFHNFEIDSKKMSNKIASKKPCAVVVLSNVQNPNMQSLLRKYRYDAKGVLIPGSVRYFFKLPQTIQSSPLLVPLNDKAFSPLGGFVRYYKEVPPIPQSW